MPEPSPHRTSAETLKVVFMVGGKPDHQNLPSNSDLQSTIQDLLERHKIEGKVEDYCLVVQKNERFSEYKIITEKDKAEMHTRVIELSNSPAVSSRKLMSSITDLGTDAVELEKSLDSLREMCGDPTFASVFLSEGWLQSLTKLVSGGKFRDIELGHALHAINSLLDHNITEVEGDNIQPDPEFVKTLAELANTYTKNSLALRCALSILTLLVKDGQALDMIDQKVAFPNLTAWLGHNDITIQLASLGLVNILLAMVGPERKKDMVRSLQDRTARTMIMDHLIPKAEQKNEMMSVLRHQLYLLQHHMLSLLQTRLNTPMMTQDPSYLQKIKDLRSTAFDTGSPGIKNNNKYAQDYTKLGFKNVKDPSLDFLQTPPGILALDCMHYFSKHHLEKYMKVVLENSCRQDSHECPFVESSCALVCLLTDLLGVGRPPLVNNTRFHEMLFKYEEPFEEFFSYCVVILNKTWRDMRATRQDFGKVFDVVREQLETSLMSEKHERPKTFDQFKANVKSYAEISKKWQNDAKNRDTWDKNKSVLELRNHLEPEIKDLIRQQRANFMVEGTRFLRNKKTGEAVKAQQCRYVKLHANHKTIYVGDWNSDKSVPTLEDLEPRLHVADVRDIKTGLDCDFIKEYKKDFQQQYSKLAFSLVGDNNSLLDLVAPDEQTFNYWVDGVNTLLMREMKSDDFEKEKEILTRMEIKLRLLDLEGVDLPTEAPPIPPPPRDFNFASC